jgi:photosystem II stability/assembly factor-like uncharacterized protein
MIPASFHSKKRKFPRTNSGIGFVKACIISSLVGLLTGCLLDGAGSDPFENGPGYARFSLSLSQSDRVLMKRASSDTAFSLDSVILVISAPGVSDQVYRFPVSGRADTGNIEVSSPVYSLAPLRTWKAKIVSIDTTASPARRDTVHLDSVSFKVYVMDTAQVSKWVSPVYSVFRARFLSSMPDSLPAGIKYLRLRVNGVTRDSLWLSGGDANRAVFFPSVTTGWIANDAGELQKSTDSGNTWTSQANPAGVKMNALWFNSNSQGWAVGEAGSIVKFNGSTWASQTSGVSQRLNGVMFVSGTKGFAVGDAGKVLRTLDGGTTWSLLSGGWFPLENGISVTMNGLSFSGLTIGWGVADGGAIVRTTNGGDSWSAQTSGTSNVLKAVHALNTTTVVAVGSGGVIRRTSNGGTSTWTTVSSGVTSDLLDVHFANTTYGWAVGTGGVVRRSGDGGASWSSQSSGTSQTLYGVSSNGADRVLAVGAGGAVRRRTSISNTSPFTDATNSVIGATVLKSVFMLSGTNTAWVVGNGGFIARCAGTNNNDWVRQGSGVTTQNLTHVHFADANSGWVTGENGTILRTTNGGADWTVLSSGTTQTLNAVFAVDDDSVFAAGAAGTLLKTRSGGGVTTSSSNLNAVYFRGDTGYVVGEGGTSLRTANGGITWTALTGSSQNLYATFVSPSGNNVYAVGAQGTYMTSSNANFASTWDIRSSGTTQTLRGVWVSATDPGPASIYAAGDNGVIRVRNDGSIGDLDQGVSTGTTETLSGLQCQGLTNNCWAVGGNGIVLRTTTAAVGGWTHKSSGTKSFDKWLAYKYLKPGVTNTVLMEAIDRESPLRGYQASISLTLGAGQDSTLNSAMTRCGYGGLTPACSP